MNAGGESGLDWTLESYREAGRQLGVTLAASLPDAELVVQARRAQADALAAQRDLGWRAALAGALAEAAVGRNLATPRQPASQ